MKSIFNHTVFLFTMFIMFDKANAQTALSFRNFVTVGNTIYALTDSGDIKVYNEFKEQIATVCASQAKVRLLLKDHLNNIVIVNESNEVKRLDVNTNVWETIITYKGWIYAVGFNNNNDCFLITDEGIINTNTKQSYIPSLELTHSESTYGSKKAWDLKDNKRIPVYCDSKNNIWIIVNHGEWGSDFFIFNTTTNAFSDYTLGASTPFSELNNDVLGFTSGRPCFFNRIFEYTKQPGKPNIYAAKLLYDQDSDKTIPFISFVDCFRIMSITYNTVDKNLYIYTSDGLYKANPLNNISKFKNWTQIKKYKLPKRYAYGFDESTTKTGKNSQVNYTLPEEVSEMQFIQNGKLILLTHRYGLLSFDGENITTIK